MSAVIPEHYIKNESIQKALNHNGMDGLIGAGFIHYANAVEHREELRFPKYGGLLLLQGRGRYWDDTGVECDLRPGCFIHRLPDRVHGTEIVPDSKWVECYLVLGTPLFEGLKAMGIISPDKPVQNPGVSIYLADKFEALLAEIKESSEDECAVLIPKMIDLLLLINKYDCQEIRNQPYADIITEVKSVLGGNLGDKLEIKEVFSSYPISYDRLRAVFKQYTGVSAREYRIQQKISMAKDLLATKEYKVYQVADILGYPDAYSFSKQFSKFTGISPKDFLLL